MARTGKVAVSISADSSGLERGLRGAEGDLNRFGKRGGDSLHALKLAALGAGAAITGGLVVGLKQSVDAAIEAEKSQKAMEAQLKALGISYKAHAAEIDNVIQKTSQLAGLDDEELQGAFTGLVRASGSVNKSLKEMALVADIARARHMDVAKAGDLVAKVMNGNTSILTRYGIKLKDGATATEALGELQRKFSGQAEAYGKTAAGAQDRFRVATENLKESVGSHLLPTLTNVAEAAAKFVGQMESGKGAGGDFVHTLKDIFGVAKTVVGVVFDVAQAVARSKVALAGFGAALAGLALARTVNKIKELAAGFTGLASVGKFTALTSVIGLVATGISLLSGNQRSATQTAKDLANALDKERASLIQLRDSDLDAAQAKVQAKQSALALKNAEEELTRLRKTGKASADELKQAELNVSQARIQAKRDTRALADVEGSAATVRRQAIDDTRDGVKAAEANTAAIKRNRDALADNVNLITTMHRVDDDLSKKLYDLTGKIGFNAAKTQLLAEANRDLGDALGKLAVERAKNLIASLQGPLDAVRQSAQNARQAIIDLNNIKPNPDLPSKSARDSLRHSAAGLAGTSAPGLAHAASAPGVTPKIKGKPGHRFDVIQNRLGDIDLRERAGLYPGKTALDDAVVANQRRRNLLSAAIAGNFGPLTARQKLELKADRHDTLVTKKDLKDQLAAKRAKHNAKVTHAPYNAYVKAMNLIDELEAAGKLTPEQAEQQRLELIAKAVAGGLGGKPTGHEENLILADYQGILKARKDAVETSSSSADDETAKALQQTNELLQKQLDASQQQLDLMKQARDEYQRTLNVSQSQYKTLLDGFADFVSGRIGGSMGLGFMTPGYSGGLARY